jgi:hypothetical protein
MNLLHLFIFVLNFKFSRLIKKKINQSKEDTADINKCEPSVKCVVLWIKY